MTDHDKTAQERERLEVWKVSASYRSPITYEGAFYEGWKARAALDTGAVTELDPDLMQRCREIIEWRETGIIYGEALRTFADTLPEPNRGNLRRAEDATLLQLAKLSTAPQSLASASAVETLSAQERERFEAWWLTSRARRTGAHEEHAEDAWQARAALDMGAVPAGWKLVPVKPTQEMIRGGWIDKEDVNPDDIYAAMLDAAPQPPASADAEPLGRFGHHPEPATDFCVEVEEIEGEAENIRVGFENGTPSRDERRSRIERAMEFRVGGDEGAVRAKDRLREIEAEFCAPASVSAGKVEPVISDDVACAAWAAAQDPDLRGDDIEEKYAAVARAVLDATGKVEPSYWAVQDGGWHVGLWTERQTAERILLEKRKTRPGTKLIPLYAAPPAHPDDFERGAEAMRVACIQEAELRGHATTADAIRALPLPKKEG